MSAQRQGGRRAVAGSWVNLCGGELGDTVVTSRRDEEKAVLGRGRCGGRNGGSGRGVSGKGVGGGGSGHGCA